MSVLAPATRRFALGSATVAVDDWAGDGEPVLLLHGIPGSRASWTKVARALAPAHRVLAPDLLGFGDSGPCNVAPHSAGQAAVMGQLLDELGLERVHLVGFDFGGPTAVLLSRALPERVGSLTVAATNLFADTPVPLMLRAARVPGIGAGLMRVMLGRTGQRMLWRVAAGDRKAFPRAAYERHLTNRATVRSTRQIFAASMRDMAGLYGPVAAALNQIRVPALVVWGTSDPFFAVAVGERTAAALTGARFVTLPGCGHFVPEERPVELARAIAELLRDAGSERMNAA